MKLIKKIFYITIIVMLALIINISTVNAANVEITTETLNLRKEPSTDSDIVAQISIGEECELIEDDGEWYKVKYGEYTGYISKDYAKIVGDNSEENNADNENEGSNKKEENNNGQSTNTVGENNTSDNNENSTTNDLDDNEKNNTSEENNVQQTSATNGIAKVNKNTSIKILPLINSSNLETLNNNTEVTIITELNGWSYVQTDEISGWVRTENLDISNSNDEKDNNNSDNDKDNNDSSDNNSDVSSDDNNNDNGSFEEKTMYTNDSYVNIRKEPSTTSEIIMCVEQNTELTVVGETGDWYEVETSQGKAYVSKELLSEERTTVTNRGSVDRTEDNKMQEKETQDKEENKEAEVENTSTSNSAKAEEIVEYAKKFLGVPYVYGGASPSGFDCSGFTMYVFDHFGISMRHGAQAQAKLGEKISADKNSKSSLLNNLEVGDLVFFLDYETMDEIGHCGIYIGDGNFIHASSGSGYCVKINSLLPGEYYNTRYCAARRVL